MELLHTISVNIKHLEEDIKKRIDEFVKENGVSPEIEVRYETLMMTGSDKPVHTETIVNAHIVIDSKANKNV